MRLKKVLRYVYAKVDAFKKTFISNCHFVEFLKGLSLLGW